MGAIMSQQDHDGTHVHDLYVGQVVSNERICREHLSLDVELPRFGRAVPGQFVELRCAEAADEYRPARHEWSGDQLPHLEGAELSERVALLRRPFSIATLRDGNGVGGKRIELIYRVVGPGSRWMEQLQTGQRVSVLGPLGNGFAIRDDKPRAWLISGGIGVAPLIWLAEELKQAGKDVVAFCGARSADLMPLRSTDMAGDVADPLTPLMLYHDYARSGVPVVAATDDGSAGFRGLVSEAVAEYSRRHVEQKDQVVVYACGPEPMLEAVARFCRQEGIDLQVCVERMMACGLGTCQSCVVRVRDDGAEEGWRYVLACVDGPVFDGDQMVW